MAVAYVDDSIASSGAKRLFLAAYVSTAEIWEQFVEAWDQELAQKPSIEYFKMSEAAARSGQFRGWEDEDRWAKIHALAQVINRFKPIAFHNSVSTLEFNRILKGNVDYPHRTPYWMLCEGLMINVARIHMMTSSTVPVSFIFDDHPGLATKVVPLFEYMKRASSVHEKEKSVISGSPRFEDDKNIKPLQAADMLAWFVRRRHEGTLLPQHREIAELISLPGRHFEARIDAELLQLLADEYNSLPRPARERTTTKEGWFEMLDFLEREFERSGRQKLPWPRPRPSTDK